MNSPTDEISPIHPLMQALEALQAAEMEQYKLASLLSEDAEPKDFGNQSIDARITKVCGEVIRRRYEFDRALCTLSLGEPFRNEPTAQAVRIEMQTRAHRQVNGRRFDLLRTAMAAVDAAPADAPLPVPERKPVRDLADFEAGFHPSVA